MRRRAKVLEEGGARHAGIAGHELEHRAGDGRFGGDLVPVGVQLQQPEAGLPQDGRRRGELDVVDQKGDIFIGDAEGDEVRI